MNKKIYLTIILITLIMSLFITMKLRFNSKEAHINKNLEEMYNDMIFYHEICFCFDNKVKLTYFDIINYFGGSKEDSSYVNFKMTDPYSNKIFKTVKLKNKNDTLLLLVAAGIDLRIDLIKLNSDSIYEIDVINKDNFYNFYNYFDNTNIKIRHFNKALNKHKFYDFYFGKKDFILGLINCKK